MVRTISSCTQWVSFEKSEEHLLSCSLCWFFPDWMKDDPSLVVSKLHARFFRNSVTPELTHLN